MTLDAEEQIGLAAKIPLARYESIENDPGLPGGVPSIEEYLT